MALTALGITELKINFSDQAQRTKAIIYFKKSFELDDQNPLTMKHLADHYFFCNELDIALILCKKAIKKCDSLKKSENSDLATFRSQVQMLKSDLYFILGKVCHKKENYEEAKNCYF